MWWFCNGGYGFAMGFWVRLCVCVFFFLFGGSCSGCFSWLLVVIFGSFFVFFFFSWWFLWWLFLAVVVVGGGFGGFFNGFWWLAWRWRGGGYYGCGGGC